MSNATASKAFIAFIVGSRVLFGAAYNIVLKDQSLYKIKPCENCDAQPFNHPYVQELCVFFSEVLCGIFYLFIMIKRKIKKEPQPQINSQKQLFQFKRHIFYILIPVVFDLGQTAFFNLGMYYCLSSIHSMLKNLTVLFTAGISIILFKRTRSTFDLPQLSGLVILLTGALVVGAMSILYTAVQQTSKDATLGAIMIVVATFLSSLYYTAQEWVLNKIQIEQMLMMFLEGCWGMSFGAIFISIFNATTPKIEDLQQWLFEVNQQPVQILLYLVLIVCAIMSAAAGIYISFYLSSASRVTIDSCRIIIIWVVSFALSWEQFNAVSTPVKMLGFVLIVSGVLIYNNILKLIPYLRQINIEKYGKWMGRKQKANEKKLKKQVVSLNDAQTYE